MPCAYIGVIDARFAVSFAAFGIPAAVFWPYFSGCALLLIGLLKILKDEWPQAQGLEKFLPFGRLFLAMPMAVFGTEHFTDTADIVNGVPSWMPAHTFWVYLVGIALIAAAVSITLQIQSRLAAILLGAMLGCFVLLIHIPNIVANAGNRIVWTVGLRDLAFSGGAFAFAGTQMRPGSSGATPRLVTVARFFIGIPALIFGVENFLYPTFAPGVPLGKITPEWVPGRLIWAYLAGAVLLASGACIVMNKKTRLAAAYLGVMILLLVLFVYVPVLVASPADIVSLNYVVDTLVFSGAALVLADASGQRVNAD